MKIFGHTLRYNDLYIEGFALFLVVLSLSEPLCFFVFLAYLIWQRRNIRWQFFAILCLLLCTRYFLFSSQQDVKVIDDHVKVVDIDHYDTSHRLTITYLGHRYHVYVYDDDIAIGDWVYLKGKIVRYERETIPFGFNSQQYYLSQNVLGKVDVETLDFSRSGKSIFSVRMFLIDRVQSPYASMVKSFVFGKDYLENDDQVLFQKVNLLFLMQTTGLHAYFLSLGIRKLMFYFNVNPKIQEGVVLTFYAILCYLNAFAIGVVRLLFSQIFNFINHRYQLRLTPLDRLFSVCFIMIMISFCWVYSTGFLMTFLILLTIELARDRYQSYHGYLRRLMISVLIAGACLPFTKIISPFVILMLPFIIFYVTALIYPLAFMVLISPKVDVLLGYLLNGLTRMVNMLNSRQVIIYLPALNHWQIFLYYVGFAYVLLAYKRKQLIARMLLVTSLFGYQIVNQRYLNDASVYFLDVGQGDTIFIETRSCRTMIDSFNGASDFLKNRGINQLDYLFLTHSDEDHISESDDIIDDIGVDHLIVNPYDYHYPAYQKPVTRALAGQSFSCGNLTFSILGPLKTYATANDNSLVIAVTIEHDQYLFLGDISQTVELDLVTRYGKQLKSDFIKIAHHGSNTSTSEELIEHVMPSYAIISVGRYNQFDFPSKETLSILKKHNVAIHRTDQEGTVVITYKHAMKLWETTLSIFTEF